jgi:hypothetical protein
MAAEKDEKLLAAKQKAAPAAAKTKDGFLATKYSEFEDDATRYVQNEISPSNRLRQLGFNTETEMLKGFKNKLTNAFNEGYRSININSDQLLNATLRSRNILQDRSNFYIQRLIRNTIDALSRQDIDSIEKDDRIQKVKAIFDALKYRANLIEDLEIKKAYNLGMLQAASDLGKTSYTLEITDNSCASCKEAAKNTYTISSIIDLDNTPPFHPNSKTKIKIS